MRPGCPVGTGVAAAGACRLIAAALLHAVTVATLARPALSDAAAQPAAQTAAETAPPAAEAPGEPQEERSCVDVRVGSARSYSCLNDQLAWLVPGHRASSADAPVNAWLAAPAAGTFNQAALREHLGTAYGYSVVPQRPPLAVYPLPFATTAAGRR